MTHSRIAVRRTRRKTVNLLHPNTLCTTSFNTEKFCVLPTIQLMCFAWISEQTAIISLYSINLSLFITEAECLLRGTDWVFKPDSYIFVLVKQLILIQHALRSGFGGLGTACWPLLPKFAGSNPAEAVGFVGRKNPQHAFLRRGSKAVGSMS